jgi:hypothetical protein
MAIELAIYGDAMKPKKRPVDRGGITKWEVDFGIMHGHRKRPLRDTEAEADKLLDQYKKDVKKGGEFWARLPESDRLEITATLIKIREAGHTIATVWADWQRWKKDNQQSTTTPMPYEDVVAEWKRRKQDAGQSQRYVDEAARMLMKFGKGREKQPIHEILPEELEAWFELHKANGDGVQDDKDDEIDTETQDDNETRKWGLSTRRTNMGRFSSLWTVAKAKGWCSLNIVDRLEPVGKIGVTVEIYDNATTLNMMTAVMANDATKKIIAPITLGFFGCMRPEEVEHEKFGWDFIDLKHGLITITPEVGKTGDQRVIRLQPIAVSWLKLAKEEGNPLPPVNERRLVDQCCAMIGLNEWIRDGMRKNCATHLRAVYKNDYDVVKDMGNSIRILLKYYADLHVPEEVSLEHWKITPAKVQDYLKTKEWEQLLRSAARTVAEKTEAAIEASVARKEQSASETSKSEN